MSNGEIETMWFSLSLCDDEGQCKPGFALEARSISLFGLDDRGMVFDVVHVDGEKERIRFTVIPGSFFSKNRYKYRVEAIETAARRTHIRRAAR